MATDPVIRAFLVVMSVLIVGTEIFRQVTAVAALRRAGLDPAGWGNWRVGPEMRQYRELLVREGRSLRWWRLWWALHATTFAVMLAFAGYVITGR